MIKLPNELNNQSRINLREKIVLKHFKQSRVAIESSTDKTDIYNYIDDCNKEIKHKVQIAYDQIFC